MLIMLMRCVLLLFPLSLGAAEPNESAEEKGLWIAQQSHALRSDYGSEVAQGHMELRDKQGRRSVREFEYRSLEVPNDGDKSMIVFQSPPDIALTALLTVAHKQRDDDQWLFLPALKRVKRISGSSRTGPFVASEFSFEDLIEPEIDKYRYRWIRDEPCPGALDLNCFVNEEIPTSSDSGYSKLLVWIDQEKFRTWQIRFFDRKGSQLKTLSVRDHRQYEDKHWRAHKLLMENHQNGRSTLMSWSDFDFSIGYRDEDFSRRALERLR